MTKLLINEHPLMVLPTLAKKIGLNEALILQQLHYWLNPKTNTNKKDGKHWVFNSYVSWKEQFPFWSETTIKRTILSLEKQSLVISKNFNNSSFNKTKWYTIDYKKLSSLEILDDRMDQNDPTEKMNMHDRIDQNDPRIRSNRPEDKAKMSLSNIETETTTKTTTEISLRERDLEVLLKEWNTKIQTNGSKVSLTDKRAKNLRKIFKAIFAEDVSLWKDYIETISKSNFLMGNITNFRVNFDWATKTENVLKVLEGTYSERNKEQENSCQEIPQKIENYINSIQNNLWKELSKIMLKEWGNGIFISWFMKLNFDSIKNRTLYLRPNSRFIKNYVETHYLRRIEKIVKANFYDSFEKVLIYADDS